MPDEVTRTLLEAAYPALIATGYEITSPADTVYNCVAHAVKDATDWWWPT